MTDRNDRPAPGSFKATLAILGVALTGVLLLFAINRTGWFELRPASGTAAALWHASAGSPATTAAAVAPAPAVPRG